MAHILKHREIELWVDLPSENYQQARFDWTGKITSLKFKGIQLSGVEIADTSEDVFGGKGFYNEFGIDSPLGFNETKIGGLFHKIGVGVLKKREDQYAFHQHYDIIPAQFECLFSPKVLRMKCQSQVLNGYAYDLEKKIELLDAGFVIHYQLKNKGEKPIVTDEYNHNFISIDNRLMDTDYQLKFPFILQPAKFGEMVNPERKVIAREYGFGFNATPTQQFFFSNLSGGKMVDAHWQLENLNSKIGIAETGDFQTDSINLWGWKHVISPELFFKIHLDPGQSVDWKRTYTLYEID